MDGTPTIAQPFPDVGFLEVPFIFSTAVYECKGAAKLVYSSAASKWQASVLFTLAQGLHDSPELIGNRRPLGTHNASAAWGDLRAVEADFGETHPSVIIGGVFFSSMVPSNLQNFKQWDRGKVALYA